MIPLEIFFVTAVGILVVAFLDYTKIMILVALLLGAKLCAIGRTSRLEMNYDKKSKLFQKFIQTSKISTLEYQPYLFAPSFPLQGIFYMACEIFL